MYNNLKIVRYSGAIALCLTFLSFSSALLNAQESTSEYRFLQNIEAGNNADWSFSSEDESLSVKDDIKKLEDYSLSDSDPEVDLQLTREDRRWGNRGNVEDYSIEAEFYDY